MKQNTIDRIRKFTSDREWEQYHTPVNLAKSISIEANELLECFQWSNTDFDIDHVKEELADVLEILKSIVELNDKKLDDVVEVAKQKRLKRGGFEKRIFLEKTYKK